jgi:2,5-furandicarboxylate decarboxylase 1
MPTYDLPAFIETVRREKPKEIVQIRREVSPQHETLAILTKFEQSYRSPLLFFERIRGCEYPLANNVCGSTARLALGLGCSVGELSECYARRCACPCKPVLQRDGATQEVVATGATADLTQLPQLIYHEGDAPQPYLTAAIIVARDPQSGKLNLSYHRLMVTGRNTTSIFMARGKHLDGIWRKYEKAAKPMPIAAFIGVHPTCALGAVYTGPAEVEEYDIIGGLQERPLPVVACVTDASLHVPADAEFVLEGYVSPAERTAEGPFGEFTGYATGVSSAPVFHIRAVTHKKKPIFQDIASGHLEHQILPVLAMEQHLSLMATAAVPGCLKIKVNVPLTVVAVVDKSNESQPRQLMDVLIDSDVYVKQVIVVDPDVDPSDLRQVCAAIVLHAQPHRDIVVYEQRQGTELDPSAGPNGVTSKIGIDATKKTSASRRVVKNAVPRSVLDRINIAEFLNSSSH